MILAEGPGSSREASPSRRQGHLQLFRVILLTLKLTCEAQAEMHVNSWFGDHTWQAQVTSATALLWAMSRPTWGLYLLPSCPRRSGHTGLCCPGRSPHLCSLCFLSHFTSSICLLRWPVGSRRPQVGVSHPSLFLAQTTVLGDHLLIGWWGGQEVCVWEAQKNSLTCSRERVKGADPGWGAFHRLTVPFCS